MRGIVNHPNATLQSRGSEHAAAVSEFCIAHAFHPTGNPVRGVGLETPTPTQVGLVGGNLPQKSGQPVGSATLPVTVYVFCFVRRQTPRQRFSNETASYFSDSRTHRVYLSPTLHGTAGKHIPSGPAHTLLSQRVAQPRCPLNQNLTRSCPCSREHLKYTGKMERTDASLNFRGKALGGLVFLKG